jgi:5-methylcytosine-specific restriction endonuclease McrA
VCGNQFEYEVKRGADRVICSAECQSAKRKTTQHLAVSGFAACIIEGCCSKVRSAQADYCETHYYRIRRNGTIKLKTDTDPPPNTIRHSHGYVLEYAPEHFEAARLGVNRVAQHRRVFYDHNGSGPFNCHWCQKLVTWEGMHVDHVNAVRDDNRVENLVAACPACNHKRGHPKGKATHRERSPVQITWHGRTRCIADWADDIGIDRNSLQWRIKAGWPIDKAMTEPRGKTGPKADRP